MKQLFEGVLADLFSIKHLCGASKVKRVELRPVEQIVRNGKASKFPKGEITVTPIFQKKRGRAKNKGRSLQIYKHNIMKPSREIGYASGQAVTNHARWLAERGMCDDNSKRG